VGKEKSCGQYKEQDQKAGTVLPEPLENRSALILNESGTEKTTGSRQEKAE